MSLCEPCAAVCQKAAQSADAACRGEGWGEQGYFRMIKDVPAKEGHLGALPRGHAREFLCIPVCCSMTYHAVAGVAMAASYPTKNSPNPKARPAAGLAVFCAVLTLHPSVAAFAACSMHQVMVQHAEVCAVQNNPEVCGYFGFSECEAGSKCSCRFSFFNLFCLSWGCADAAHEL